MKILVTGGAGFIGSAVIRHIINHTQDSVINVDKLTYAGNLESLSEVESMPLHLSGHSNSLAGHFLAWIIIFSYVHMKTHHI